MGEVGLGNRKDVRNAVEAARKAGGWASTPAYTRSQILYFVAENLAAREAELTARLAAMTGDEIAAASEVAASIDRTFTWASWCDKYDGAVHHTPIRNVTLAMPEPLGVVGVLAPDESPLLAFLSLTLPLIALGNRVVAVPSPRHPLAVTDFYQVLDTSDVPGGVFNIVTGERDELAGVLARHDDVAAVWYFGGAEGSAMVERESIGNLKQTWVSGGKVRDWYDPEQGAGAEYRRRSTQIKNIWVPYGE